ncbi:MAG: hypothetical protein HUU01_14150 [Saprospiraceae bacterium]|nr:hypothetical protein [Saprospiraceae bacterium]
MRKNNMGFTAATDPQTIEIAGIQCQYEFHGDTLLMNIDTSSAADFMENFFADRIAEESGRSFETIGYLNTKTEPAKSRQFRVFWGAVFFGQSVRVLLIFMTVITPVAWLGISPLWAIPIMLFANFLFGYFFGEPINFGPNRYRYETKRPG